MSYPKTKYRLTKNCFEGNKGEIIIVDESGESSTWHNLRQNTMGSPFLAYDFTEEVRE